MYEKERKSVNREIDRSDVCIGQDNLNYLSKTKEF